MGNSSPYAKEGTSATDRLCKRGEQLLVHGRYHRKGNRLEKDYELTQEVLGEGITGKIRLARNRRSGDRCAVKSFNFGRQNTASLHAMATEVEAMFVVDHPNIVRIMDAYETDDNLHLVMECMEGGELFDRLHQRKRFEEDEAAEILRQMFSAVAYLHGRGIVHRDLKPENVLFEAQGGNHLKLTDFGFARYWDATSTPMTERAGTAAYAAPEVTSTLWQYTHSCDVWSLGVISFMMLGGYVPFGGTAAQLKEDVLHARYNWCPERWENVSLEAIQFVKSLLTFESERPTACDALQNPWLVKGRHMPSTPDAFHTSVLLGLQHYQDSSKLRQACLKQIARSMNCTDYEQVRSYFSSVTALHEGVIYLHQVIQVARASEGFDAEAVSDILKEMDPDQPIEFTEFLAAMIPTVITPRNSLVVESFCRFDNSSLVGTAKLDKERISHHNVKAALGMDDREAKMQLAGADTSQCGRLYFADFQKLVESPLSCTEAGISSNSSDTLERDSKFLFRAPERSNTAFKLRKRDKAKIFFKKVTHQIQGLPESLATVAQGHPALAGRSDVFR